MVIVVSIVGLLVVVVATAAVIVVLIILDIIDTSSDVESSVHTDGTTDKNSDITYASSGIYGRS